MQIQMIIVMWKYRLKMHRLFGVFLSTPRITLPLVVSEFYMDWYLIWFLENHSTSDKLSDSRFFFITMYICCDAHRIVCCQLHIMYRVLFSWSGRCHWWKCWKVQGRYLNPVELLCKCFVIYSVLYNVSLVVVCQKSSFFYEFECILSQSIGF